MNWAGFLHTGPESVPVLPALGRALGDGDMGIFLSVCAWLTAREGGGSFIRHYNGIRDRWDYVLPWPKRSLRRKASFIFGKKEVEAGHPLLQQICDNATRGGKHKDGIYVFGSTPVLEALNGLLEEGSVHQALFSSVSISAGSLWWEGDVHVWKQSMARELEELPVFTHEHVGYLPQLLDLMLQELWERWKGGSFTSESGDFSESFRGYLLYRYTHTALLSHRLHEFDLFWAASRGIVGLRVRRPMRETDPHTYRAIHNEVLACIDRIRACGLTVIGFLQRYSEYMTVCARDPSMTHLLSEAALEEVLFENTKQR